MEDLVRRCFNFLTARLIFPLLLTSMLDMNVAAVAYFVFHQHTLVPQYVRGCCWSRGMSHCTINVPLDDSRRNVGIRQVKRGEMTS